MMKSVEGQIRGGRRNHVQISMYEQRGQIEQAKHRLCTTSFCGGVLVVLGTRLLSGNAHGCCPLPQGR